MKVTVSIQTKAIPMDYTFLFTSLLKKSLELSNPIRKKELYEFKDGKANKKPKPITGAINLGGYSLIEEIFYLSSPIQWIISSYDPSLIIDIYNGLLQLKKFIYKTYELEILHVKIENSQPIKQDKILVKTNSPLIVKTKDNKFITPEDDDFNENLQYIIKEVKEKLTNSNLIREIIITPLDTKKKVIKLKNNKFANLKNNTLYMNATVGVFLLEGDPQDLEFCLLNGIGFRRSEFFGSLELISD